MRVGLLSNAVDGIVRKSSSGITSDTTQKRVISYQIRAIRMLTKSILMARTCADLELSEPLVVQEGLDICAPSQAQPGWSQVWLKLQFEGKEGAALSLFGNEHHYPLDPFRLPWKLEGIAILKLLHLLI